MAALHLVDVSEEVINAIDENSNWEEHERCY